MKVNELRIGNYILDGGDVEEVTYRVIEMLVKNQAEFDPIPLTEEWLVRFDGRKTIVEDYPIYFVNPFDIEFYGYESVVLIGERAEVKVKYVHQLQNLYFALTGKELILTL
jgi:hypothetical protein